MRRIHIAVLALAGVVLSAASLSAQASAQPDTPKLGRLATVTVTAERSGNRFTRAAEERAGVLFLMEENRKLMRELRVSDARVAHLATKLDSLQRVEAAGQRALAVTSDSLAAIRTRRAALEARILALETPRGPK